MSDQSPDAGWYPDPTGRYERRYWTGEGWTEWVLVAGAQQVDRFWDGPRIGGDPHGTAATVGTAPASGRQAAAPARVSRGEALRDRLARPRPRPSVQSAVAAAAGVAVVLGIVVLAGDAPDRTAVALLGLVITTIAYGLALVGPELSRSAGLAGAVVGPAMVVAAALGEVFSGTAQVVFPLVCIGTVWLVMFVAPGFTGAPILLAGSLLAGWGALVTAIWGDGLGQPGEPVWLDSQPQDWSAWQPDPLYTDAYYVDAGPLQFDLQGVTSTTAVVTLLAALACVVAAGVADRRGWHVLGTPFVATGVVLSAFGLYVAAIAFMGDAEVVALLTFAVGVSLLVVGALGDRRGSVWIGAATGFSGLLALLVQNIDSQTGGGIVLLILGAVLFAAAPALERIMRRPEAVTGR